VSYVVKEVFYSLQGEGAQSGRGAVFCRFSGCNLWSGREAHRTAAACRFCDTDFVAMDGPGGGRYADADALAAAVADAWPGGGRPLVVLTGGEPLLQLDAPLIDALHEQGFELAVETNGTLPVPPHLDWLCVSPKGSAPLAINRGNELKLVYPQDEAEAQPGHCACLVGMRLVACGGSGGRSMGHRIGSHRFTAIHGGCATRRRRVRSYAGGKALLP